MILVDASVLIDYLRTKDPKLDKQFRTSTVAICGVTRAEILAGARSAKDRVRLVGFLARFHQAPTPETWWDLVGDNLAALYARGVSVPFPDAVVATVGIENDVEVWARDPHFPIMQTALPRLKLYKEPP
jgi:predicted nucleic acid-binding protein